MAATRKEVLGLYKQIQKYANTWDNYGFREYTKRRARDAFKLNKNITNPEEITKCISEARQNLGILYYALNKVNI